MLDQPDQLAAPCRRGSRRRAPASRRAPRDRRQPRPPAAIRRRNRTDRNGSRSRAGLSIASLIRLSRALRREQRRTGCRPGETSCARRWPHRWRRAWRRRRSARRRRPGPYQGRLHVCGAGGGSRLHASSTISAAARWTPSSAGKVKTTYRRERARGRGRRAGDPQAGAEQRPRVHHLVRLHEPDGEGRPRNSPR